MAPLPTCEVCGEYLAESEQGKRAHMKRYHNVTVKQAARLTPEEKARIVARVEERLGDRIITSEPEHSTECRCPFCFNKQLDRVLAGLSNTWGNPND